MIRLTHTKRIEMDVVNEINRMGRFLQELITMKKKCYCCGSGTHVLNNCDIRDAISRDQWFDITVDLHIRHQQSAYKEDEQTVESDADVIFFQYEKKRLNWITNQFSWQQTSDKIRVRFERNYYDGKWH